jgi:hypothetical protein
VVTATSEHLGKAHLGFGIDFSISLDHKERFLFTLPSLIAFHSVTALDTSPLSEENNLVGTSFLVDATTQRNHFSIAFGTINNLKFYVHTFHRLKFNKEVA